MIKQTFNYGKKLLSRPQFGFRYCFIDRMKNSKLSFSHTNLKILCVYILAMVLTFK